MKIQCDVCSKEEASVFCIADEAALCDGCDHRVHHANKLASKHSRFSLLHPSSKDVPICDICKEKRAILFCQQDRAILCGDCDVPIHTANEYTQKHHRFLLTGVKLSATSELYVSSSFSSCQAAPAAASHLVPDFNSPTAVKRPVGSAAAAAAAKSQPAVLKSSLSSTPSKVANKGVENLRESECLGTTSSISEYLIEMLPGWHVDDFLDPSLTSPFAVCQSNDGLLKFGDWDIDNNNTNCFPSENMGIWVPQAPNAAYPVTHYRQLEQQGVFKATKEVSNTKANRKSIEDPNLFAVPQISHPYTGTKRSRAF